MTDAWMESGSRSSSDYNSQQRQLLLSVVGTLWGQQVRLTLLARTTYIPYWN